MISAPAPRTPKWGFFIRKSIQLDYNPNVRYLPIRNSPKKLIS